jgi:RimJ/RimL family protein N-acetyltransferase
MISFFKTDTSKSFAKKHQERTGHDLSPHSVFCFKIPLYMHDGRVRLRPLRISDIPFMYNKLQDKDLLKAIGLTRPFTGSCFHLWWWLRKTFIFRYAIEADSRLIGFMGLYDLMPGKSSELTLLIADEKCRRLGYGSSAFSLLAQALERYSSIEKLIVKVRADNEAARSFWSKLGFEKQDDLRSLQVMSIKVNSQQKRL